MCASVIPEYGHRWLGQAKPSVFTRFGAPRRLLTSRQGRTGRGAGPTKGFAFVEMSDDQEVRAAIERLNGTRMGDRTIVVNEARDRQSTGSRGFQGRDRH
jgi:RNA recognition motif-containing protein